MVHGSGRPPGTEQCEILFELSSGNGVVALGRLLRGHDAGRLVTLRRVTGQEVALAPMVDISRSIAHPSLAKVLGIARSQGEAYLASEYMPGVSLFELRQAVITRGRPLPVAAAARIIVDALKATATAQRVLREVTGVDSGRNFFAEHVCVAEYGETLLSEVGIAVHLTSGQQSQRTEDDVRSAALELYALVTGRSFVGPWRRDGSVSAPLDAVLERALDSGPKRFRDVAAFLNELTASKTIPLASEEGVSEALQAVVGDLLDTRRGKLDLVERASARRDADESTQFFRASEFTALQERDTARPPPETAELTPPVAVPAVVRKITSAVVPRPAPAPAPVPAPAPRVETERDHAPEGDGDGAADEEEATQFWRRAELASAPRAASNLPPSSAPAVSEHSESAPVAEPLGTASTAAEAEPLAATEAATEGEPLDEERAVASFRPSAASRWLLLLAVLLLLLAGFALYFER